MIKLKSGNFYLTKDNRIVYIVDMDYNSPFILIQWIGKYQESEYPEGILITGDIRYINYNTWSSLNVVIKDLGDSPAMKLLYVNKFDVGGGTKSK